VVLALALVQLWHSLCSVLLIVLAQLLLLLLVRPEVTMVVVLKRVLLVRARNKKMTMIDV
jgi:hypothetical protein